MMVPAGLRPYPGEAMKSSLSPFQPPGWIAVLAASLLGLSFCTRLPSPASRPVSLPGPETGVASWYGPGFDGRPTSNREVYDRHAMTAAHPWLPFDTKVRVTNLDNGRSTEVRINDRGPFVGGRIIDLSYAAAGQIGMIGPGTARVRVDVLECPRAASSFVVQAGAFSDEAKARALAASLGRAFPRICVEGAASQGRTVYRVRIPADDRTEADRAAHRLSGRGIPAIVLELSGRAGSARSSLRP